MKIYLNSYRPLVCYLEGQQAIVRYNLPPFIDYSCRKEPDFMSMYPSISALCRAGKFAPRLFTGDLVVYITCKGSFLDLKQRHWRLTAILEVLERFESHSEAAIWYSNQGVTLPSNCMVSYNPPLSLEKTAPITEFGTDLRRWDLAYQKRARQYGVFLACTSQFMDLHHPPIITDEIMYQAFNRIPSTQNPPSILLEEFNKLKNLCGI